MTLWFWNAGWTAALVNHLWQSTVVVLVAWLLVLALRSNPARVRYAIWMLASAKFLLPFALLASLGSHWARPVAGQHVGSALYTAMDEVAQPFQSQAAPTKNFSQVPAHLPQIVPALLTGVWLCGFILMLARWMLSWRRAARTARDAVPVFAGREIEALRRAERNAGIRRPIPLLLSSRAVEPGVFGIVRPVLLWPSGISEHLTDAQIQSVAAHEIEHVRRRDNLTSAMHALVEALFWFHPAVRWMGARLMEERERACDERVVEQSECRQAYAESILKVCAFCLEPPAACVSGVSGSDLKQRVLRIMSHRSGLALNFSRRILLTAAAVLILTLPIGFGVLSGQSAAATSGTRNSQVAREIPHFDVVSIKPTPPNQDRTLFQYLPDATSFSGAPMRVVLQTVFGVDGSRIIGAPSWVNTNRYDIEAKVAPEDAPKLDKLNGDDRRAMLIPLLTERFHLKYHHQTREQSMYALLVAKGGPRLTRGEPDPPPGWKPAKDTPPEKEHYRILSRPGHIEADSVPMSVLADPLTRYLGRTVVDKTGLAGNYNLTLNWTPDNDPFPGVTQMLREADGLGATSHSENATDSGPSSLFRAIQEQLGLKLESEKGSVDVIVIDHIDPPSPN